MRVQRSGKGKSPPVGQGFVFHVRGTAPSVQSSGQPRRARKSGTRRRRPADVDKSRGVVTPPPHHSPSPSPVPFRSVLSPFRITAPRPRTASPITTPPHRCVFFPPPPSLSSTRIPPAWALPRPPIPPRPVPHPGLSARFLPRRRRRRPDLAAVPGAAGAAVPSPAHPPRPGSAITSLRPRRRPAAAATNRGTERLVDAHGGLRFKMCT